MVGPIDLQNVISKVSNVEKAQHQQQQQPLVDIQEYAQETSEKASLKESQVQKSPAGEEAKLQNNPEGGQPQEEKGKAKEETAATEEAKEEEIIAADPNRGQHIDIKA